MIFRKKNDEWLLAKLKTWPNPWVKKHALRTLIKNGKPGALKLVGYDTIDLKVTSFRLNKNKIKLGQKLEIDFTVHNHLKRAVRSVIDVQIYFLKSNLKHNVKVFKGIQTQLRPDEKYNGQLQVPLRKVTTRKYYPGVQYVALLVNGHQQQKKEFKLSL